MRKVHNMTLDDMYFEMVKNKEKTVELRVNDEKRKDIQVGDFILFTNKSGTELDYKSVIGKQIFGSFEEAVSFYGCKKLMPNLVNDEDVVNAYKSIPSYESNVKKFGCVAFTLY